MSFKLTFLGTSSMVPTKKRNVQAIYLEYKGEGMLIDCGEGTQRQMNIAKINRLKVKKIFITHWHGDHVSGLIGLIQTIGNTPNPGKLEIYGPVGSKKYMKNILQSCIFDLRINIDVIEIEAKKPKSFLKTKDFEVFAADMEHGVPCLAFRFVENNIRKMSVTKLKNMGLKGPLVGQLQRGKTVEFEGKKILPDEVSKIQKGKVVTIILDTKINQNAYSIAQESDILISEATYESDKEEKAEEYNHMTATQAALLAKKAGAKKLYLTHFSQRYKDVSPLKKEARQIFNKTFLAKDFLEVKL